MGTKSVPKHRQQAPSLWKTVRNCLRLAHEPRHRLEPARPVLALDVLEPATTFTEEVAR